jgi:hypothetical protein
LLQKAQTLAYKKYASALNFFRAQHLTIFEQPPCSDHFQWSVKAHDGTIRTAPVDESWGTDKTTAMIVREGNAAILFATGRTHRDLALSADDFIRSEYVDSQASSVLCRSFLWELR